MYLTMKFYPPQRCTRKPLNLLVWGRARFQFMSFCRKILEKNPFSQLLQIFANYREYPAHIF